MATASLHDKATMVKTRVLKTRLRQLLSGEELKHPSLVAQSIGIAENTLRPLLEDEWQQLGRDTIERVCDRFGLSVNQLFEFEPDTFWDPFVEAKRYCLLIGAGQSQGKHEPRDAKARAIVTNHLATTFPEIQGHIEIDVHDVNQIVDRLATENCIVVGSPRTNTVTEVVFSRHFGASVTSRTAIPYRFVFSKDRDIESALAEPWREGRGRNSGVGICNQSGDELVVEIDWWSADAYAKRIIPKALDCGLVLVINRPLGTTKNVKTIVVAGLSGIGTEAAAKALIKDFRDLEPKQSEKEVIGVIEATYKKPTPDKDDRMLTGPPRWRVLTGGRRTVDWRASQTRERR